VIGSCFHPMTSSILASGGRGECRVGLSSICGGYGQQGDTWEGVKLLGWQLLAHLRGRSFQMPHDWPMVKTGETFTI
jgi:hypothetical protein